MEEEQYAAVSASAGSRSAFGILGSLVRRITGGTVPEKPPEKTPEVAAEATVTLDDMLKSRWIIVPLPDGREARFQATTDISNGQVLHLKGQGLKLQGMLHGDVAVTVHLSTTGAPAAVVSFFMLFLSVNGREGLACIILDINK